MDFFDTVRARRSIRRFTGDPVKEADLLAMLEAARLAPSPTNLQPWHFVVIRDRNLLVDLRDVVSASLEARIAEAAGEDRKRILRSRRFYALHIFDAPVVIVVLTRRIYTALEEEPAFGQGMQSVGAAIENLFLAATALGYGGCWAALPLELASREIEALLGVEKPWYAVAMLSIGVPREKPRDVPRKPLEEIVTFR